MRPRSLRGQLHDFAPREEVERGTCHVAHGCTATWRHGMAAVFVLEHVKLPEVPS